MGIFAEVVEAALSLIILLGSLYALFSLFCIVEFFRQSKVAQAEPEPAYPPLSVLKPMKGVDPEWRDNVASFVTQDYPEYEVLLGINDARDEGLTLAREMAGSYAPKVRVVIHASNLGSNPKVSNLQGLIAEARHLLLLISDSDIRVGRGYLKQVVREYLATERVGIVTCLSKITRAHTVGAALESLTTTADFIPSVLSARRLEGVTFALGPSILLSKQALEEIGGLAAFADHLAEDYMIGNCLWKRNYRNILSSHLIEYVVGRMSVRAYLVHQLRWARTYRACRPAGFLGYGITQIFPFALLFLALHGASVVSLSAIAVVLALRYGTALMVAGMAGYNRQWFRWLWLLPAKDILSFGIWLWCFLGSHIFWRGHHYKLLKGGLMKKMD